MKKLCLVIIMAAISSVAFAQSSKWAAGINIGYGSEISKPSFGIKAMYDINKAFSVASSFNYYLKQTEEYSEGGATAEASAKYWDINCDLHWNLLSKENLKIYPLLGITYLHCKIDGSVSGGGVDIEVEDAYSEGEIGANIGVGTQFNIASHWAAGLEVKYQIISDGDSQFVPALSLMYRF